MTEISEDRRALLEAEELNNQYMRFLKGKLGKHMRTHVEAMRAAALEELAKTNPHDVTKIMDAQNKVRVCDEFFQIINDAVMIGAHAAATLNAPEE